MFEFFFEGLFFKYICSHENLSFDMKKMHEVFRKIDAPGLEIFMFAFQNSVTNSNCYESNVTSCRKLYITLLSKRVIEQNIHLNWSIHSADVNQHKQDNSKFYQLISYNFTVVL